LGVLRGEKTSDWWGFFRKIWVGDVGFARERERCCVCHVLSFKEALNFTTCHVSEA
jgi:hypothetical protein